MLTPHVSPIPHGGPSPHAAPWTPAELRAAERCRPLTTPPVAPDVWSRVILDDEGADLL